MVRVGKVESRRGYGEGERRREERERERMRSREGCHGGDKKKRD
jgi:hypothetical protein